MKRNIKPYYVLAWDVNRRTVEYYNIMTYLVDTYKENKKRKNKIFGNGNLSSFDDFKAFILDASKYQFWSRCEYEIVVGGFPPTDDKKKIDVYDQIEHNIDVITTHFMSQVL